jgi:hypothetical protein
VKSNRAADRRTTTRKLERRHAAEAEAYRAQPLCIDALLTGQYLKRGIRTGVQEARRRHYLRAKASDRK